MLTRIIRPHAPTQSGKDGNHDSYRQYYNHCKTHVLTHECELPINKNYKEVTVLHKGKVTEEIITNCEFSSL